MNFSLGNGINYFYQLLVNLGVSESSNPQTSRRIRGMNFLALLWIVPLLSIAVFCIKTPEWHYGLLMFMTCTMLFLVLVFNSFGNFKISTAIFLLVTNFNLTLVNVLFEFNYGTFLYLFPLFACVSFLHPLPKYKSMLTISLGSMLLIHCITYLLVTKYPSRDLVIHPQSLFTQLNYILAFTITLIIILKYNMLQSQQNLALDSKIKVNQQQKMLLEETLKERTILLSEIHHRTKNNLAIVSSMLNLQRHHVENEGLKTILLDCSNRVHSMAAVHQKLYEKGNFTKIDLKDYLEDLVKDLENTIFPRHKKIDMRVEIDSFELTSEKAIPCALILNELITNSVKHAFQETGGILEIKIKKIAHQVLLMIQDNGPGFNYNPTQNHLSLGMTLIEALTEQLDGHFEFNTQAGTVFTLTFKLI